MLRDLAIDNSKGPIDDDFDRVVGSRDVAECSTMCPAHGHSHDDAIVLCHAVVDREHIIRKGPGCTGDDLLETVGGRRLVGVIDIAVGEERVCGCWILRSPNLRNETLDELGMCL